MKPEIADDIETLIAFVEQNALPEGEDKSEVQWAASRVEVWLATYSPKNN